jgi:hypothetical protein
MASFGTDHIYNPFDTFAVYFATALQAPCLTLLAGLARRAARRASCASRCIRRPGALDHLRLRTLRQGAVRHLHDQVELVVIEARPERTGKPDCGFVQGPRHRGDDPGAGRRPPGRRHHRRHRQRRQQPEHRHDRQGAEPEACLPWCARTT